MTQPVDPALIAALNASYQSRQATPPAAAPAAQDAGLPTLDDGTVPVVSSAGVVGSVPASQVLDATRAGYRVVTPEAHREAELRSIAASDPRQMFLAGAEGAFRGLTLGGSDWYARSYGREGFADAVRLRKEANPNLATGAEIGTGILAAAATGGAGAGSLAGRGAAAGFTRYGGAGLLSRAAARVVPGLVEGAVDGAIQGVGGAISEASLHNKELTGEQLAIAMGVGGLLGGGIGGAMKVPGAARAEVARLLDRGMASEFAEGLAGKAASLRTSIGDIAGAKTEGLLGKLDAIAADQKPWLEKVAAENAVAGAGGLKAGAKEMMALAEKNPAAAKRATELLTKDIPELAGGEAALAIGTERKAMREAAGKIEKEQFKRHSGILKELDEIVPEKVDVSEVVANLRQMAAEQGVGKRTAKRELMSMAKEIEDTHGVWKVDDKGNRILVEPPRMTHQEMFRARREWDKKGYDQAALKKGQSAETYRSARDTMESFFERKADEASARAGTDLSGRWAQVKTDVAAMANVKKWLDSGVAGDLANRKMGLSEQFGLVSGMMAGSSLLGPIGGMIGGMAGTVANRLVKQRGNQAVAALATRLARGESVRTVAEGVGRAIKGEVSETLGKLPGGSRLTAALSDIGGTASKVVEGDAVKGSIDVLRSMRDRAGAVAGKIAEVGAKTATVGARAGKAGLWYGERELGAYAALRDKAHAATQGVGDDQTIARMTGSSHPDLAEALKAQQARAAGVLARVMPPAEPEQDIRGPRPPKAVPLAAMQDAVRTVDVIEDPRLPIRGIKDGSIRPSDAATLRKVYPEQFAMIAETVLDQAHGRDMSPAQMRAISVLLDAPVDASTSPAYLAAMAQGLADAPIDDPTQAAPMAQPPKRPVSAPQMGTRAFDVARGRA